jgi:hypothetical protein
VKDRREAFGLPGTKIALQRISGRVARDASQATLDLVRRVLPQPVDGDNPFFGGEPAQVVASVHRHGVTVYEYFAAWTGPHSMEERPIVVGTLCHPVDEAALKKLVRRAVCRRVAKYRRCQDCGRARPPELMGRDLLGNRVCYSCLEKRGWVF